jgi:methyl-accepting chemotaxis protein
MCFLWKSVMRLSIAYKIPALVILSSLLTGALLGVTAYWRTQNIILHNEQDRIMDSSRDHLLFIEEWANHVRQDITLLAINDSTIQALQGFQEGWETLGSEAAKGLHHIYQQKNPHSMDQRLLLSAPRDGSLYSDFHEQFHSNFRALIQERKYADIQLIGLDGMVIYTVRKQDDFAKETLFPELKKHLTSGGTIWFRDFAPYAPYQGRYAAFIAAPVLNHQKQIIGFVMIQFSGETLWGGLKKDKNGERQGNGNLYLFTSEAVLKGDQPLIQAFSPRDSMPNSLRDYLSQSHFVPSISINHVDYVANILNVNIFDRKWVLVQTKEQHVMLAGLVTLRRDTLIALLVIVTVVMGFGLLAARQIVMPLRIITRDMHALQEGNKTFESHYCHRSDEIGEMAGALEVFRKTAIQAEQLQEHERMQLHAERERQGRIELRIKQFESRFSDSLHVFLSASTSLRNAAEQMAVLLTQASQNSHSVATISHDTAENVKNVSIAAGDLSLSIRSIADQISRASAIIGHTVDQARSADGTVHKLTEAAQRIGEIINIIRTIADQINLLALNATIESARAGDAGKGFAVVASEVKTLAGQTSKATDDITTQINAAQTITSEVVYVLQQIGSSIKEVDSVSSSIAGAVAEQNHATQAIAENIQVAATGIHSVSTNIRHIDHSTQAVNESASEVLEAARNLTTQSVSLQQEVNSFLSDIQ